MHGIKQAKNGFKLTTRRLAATSIVKVTQVKHSEDDGQTQFFFKNNWKIIILPCSALTSKKTCTSNLCACLSLVISDESNGCTYGTRWKY